MDYQSNQVWDKAYGQNKAKVPFKRVSAEEICWRPEPREEPAGNTD